MKKSTKYVKPAIKDLGKNPPTVRASAFDRLQVELNTASFERGRYLNAKTSRQRHHAAVAYNAAMGRLVGLAKKAKANPYATVLVPVVM